MAGRARDEEEGIDLGISLEAVAAIVEAARAIQEGEESGRLALEEEEVEEEEVPAGMDEEALRAFINDLNEDEQASLIALAWVGRGDFSAEEWEEARALAKERNTRDPAAYLLGMEMVADLIEEGLAELGLSLEDAERS